MFVCPVIQDWQQQRDMKPDNHETSAWTEEAETKYSNSLQT